MNAPAAKKPYTDAGWKLPRSGLTQDIYVSGGYLKNNPDWHIAEGPWKAQQIVKMLTKNKVNPGRVGDIGCGAGEVLRQLQLVLGDDCIFEGFDISPAAIDLCRSRANNRLRFRLSDGSDLQQFSFDLVLVLDVIEHLEDYFSFLRRIKNKGRLTLFHIPLDLSVQTVLRSGALLKRRDLHCHIHYFTKDTALRTLREVGYEIVDHAFTPRNVDMTANVMQWVLRLPRKLFFTINKDLAVRVLGGFSLLVLTRCDD